MQHALFLDKPIRSNPRRRAQELDLSMLLSPPCETASPALSVPLTSTTEKSTTEHMAIDTFMTDHHWRTDTHSSSPASPTFPDQTLGQSSVTPGPSQQPKGRRKLTKAACSLCRQRKSKCDGKRPTCTSCCTKQKSCQYLTEEGVSSQTAYKSRLEDYGAVLSLLQRADKSECGLILEDLRRPEGLVDGVKDVLDKWVGSE